MSFALPSIFHSTPIRSQSDAHVVITLSFRCRKLHHASSSRAHNVTVNSTRDLIGQSIQFILSGAMIGFSRHIKSFKRISNLITKLK